MATSWEDKGMSRLLNEGPIEVSIITPLSLQYMMFHSFRNRESVDFKLLEPARMGLFAGDPTNQLSHPLSLPGSALS